MSKKKLGDLYLKCKLVDWIIKNANIYPVASLFYIIADFVIQKCTEDQQITYMNILGKSFYHDDIVLMNFMGYCMPRIDEKIINRLVSLKIFPGYESLWGTQSNLKILAKPTLEHIIENEKNFPDYETTYP